MASADGIAHCIMSFMRFGTCFVQRLLFICLFDVVFVHTILKHIGNSVNLSLCMHIVHKRCWCIVPDTSATLPLFGNRFVFLSLLCVGKRFKFGMLSLNKCVCIYRKEKSQKEQSGCVQCKLCIYSFCLAMFLSNCIWPGCMMHMQLYKWFPQRQVGFSSPKLWYYMIATNFLLFEFKADWRCTCKQTYLVLQTCRYKSIVFVFCIELNEWNTMCLSYCFLGHANDNDSIKPKINCSVLTI